MSKHSRSCHKGFLDGRQACRGLVISKWIGQLPRAIIFSTSLSAEAFLRRAGGSVLARTGNHGRGVERTVPAIRCMVEFNCTSANPVWGDRDQTGAQYSATELQRATADDQSILALAPQLEAVASSTGCFCSSAFLQFLSRVLWRIVCSLGLAIVSKTMPI